jgi:hypothetical protein
MSKNRPLRDIMEKLVQRCVVECKHDKHGVPSYRTIVDEAAFKKAMVQLQAEFDAEDGAA